MFLNLLMRYGKKIPETMKKEYGEPILHVGRFCIFFIGLIFTKEGNLNRDFSKVVKRRFGGLLFLMTTTKFAMSMVTVLYLYTSTCSRL